MAEAYHQNKQGRGQDAAPDVANKRRRSNPRPATIYKGSSSDSSSVFYIRFFLDDVEIQTNLLKNPNKGGG